MYFPHDTWGAFSNEPNNELEKFVQRYLSDVQCEPYDENSTAQAIASIFNDSLKPKNKLEYMKQILEGLGMPVLNPKTGEQDHVDIALVSKIVIDSEYVEDMSKNNKVKIDINLTGDAEKEEVYVTAQNEVFGKLVHTLPLQSFENILFKAINEAKDQRLEAVDEFQDVVNELVIKFVDDNRLQQKHFARVNFNYELTNGIGIIRDIKTSQDVGTFEGFSYSYNRDKRIATIDGVILSGRTFDDMFEKDRFELAFYSVEHGTVYSVMTTDKATINVTDDSITISNFDLITDPFTEEDRYYSIVTKAHELKNIIEGIDVSHPLYAAKMEEFKSSRLSILEESKQKQKQEKLVNQFADIDLF